MTAYLRSALFQVGFYGWTALCGLLYLPLLALPRRVLVAAAEIWAGGCLMMLRRLAGLRLEVRGREHAPAGAAIVASKHQSAFETIAFHLLVKDPAIVMKRELMLLPSYGWLARKLRMVEVDRSAGARALKQMVRGAAAAVAEGRPVVIFPEGTRTTPGVRAEYQPGVAALYRQLGLPVVPVALNSGVYWPRRRFLKRPGTLVVEFLPPLPPGLPRDVFTSRLTQAIEEGSERLLGEAQARGEA